MGDHGPVWDSGTGVTGYTGDSVCRIYCLDAECQWVDRMAIMLVSLQNILIHMGCMLHLQTYFYLLQSQQVNG